MARVTYKIAAGGHAETAARTVISARRHQFIIDEPRERHGDDLGPTPLESLVGSFIGCTNVIASRIATEMRIELIDMCIGVEAEVDGAILDGADSKIAFPTLHLKVSVASNGTPEQIEQLRIQLAKRCPISVLFRQSGTNIVEDWSIKEICAE